MERSTPFGYGRRMRLRALLLCVGLLAVSQSVFASDDHDEARRAVASGELKPLSDILAILEKEFAGRVLEVELERHRGNRLVYEIELLTPDGRVLEIKYDGRTGERLTVRGADKKIQ